MARLVGGCHCGNIEVDFELSFPTPDVVPVRLCVCSFCRRHGARSVADPRGRARFVIGEVAELHRYRFGLATADFLICRRCGVYVGALLEDGDSAWATLNANAFADAAAFAGSETRVNYDSETAEQRLERRRRNWTPAELVIR